MRDSSPIGDRCSLIIQRTKPGVLFVLTLLVVLLSGSTAQATDSVTTRLVVVLYPEANDGSPGSFLADRGIRSTFASGSLQNVEVHNEYLDVTRFADDASQEELTRFLRRKYAGRKVDLVIVGLASGLDFVLKYRDEIFPKAPIVFVAVDRKEVESRSLPADVIGHPISMDLEDSLDLALRLQPGIQRVYVVVGTSRFDAFWEAKARSAFGQYGDRAEINYLVGLPLAELQERLSRLPQHSLIYYLHVFEDRDKRVYMPAEVVTQLSTKANAPIYSHVDSYLGRGIVGGRVFSFQAAGEDSARLGMRILAGEDPVDIGIQPTGENAYLFDWRQLQRWGIAEANVPEGSEVRYREPTLWDQYKWQLASLIIVCAIQAMLIAGLLVQRSRRARAERRFRESREELRHLAGQILGAQESEQRRIARELHDDLGQDLALLSVELDLYRRRPSANGDADQRLEAMSARVKQLSSSVHNLSHQLHPMKLEQLGLVAAVRGLCKELSENGNLRIDFTHDGMPLTIPADVALCLYRVAQEALHNIVKHSGASSVVVSLVGDSDALCMEIRDNGSGYDAPGAAGKGGLGLANMHERLRLVGGRLQIESQRGEGTRVVARAPLGVHGPASLELRTYADRN